MSKVRWLPLESNPDVMNSYIENLGVPSTIGFFDVLGLSDDLLIMVPQPVYAVMLLYPITQKSEDDILGKEENNLKDLYYSKQTIGNACGTLAIIHALANNQQNITFNDDKYFSKFLKATKHLTPLQRGEFMETDMALGECHKSTAMGGQTEAPDINSKIDLHFVTFVEKNGHIYEMDGRRKAPTDHGLTTPENLLKDTCAVIKKFMDREPENLNFTIIALCKR